MSFKVGPLKVLAVMLSVAIVVIIIIVNNMITQEVGEKSASTKPQSTAVSSKPVGAAQVESALEEAPILMVDPHATPPKLRAELTPSAQPTKIIYEIPLDSKELVQ